MKKVNQFTKEMVEVVAAKDAKPGMVFAGAGELVDIRPAASFMEDVRFPMLALTFANGRAMEVSDNMWLTLAKEVA